MPYSNANNHEAAKLISVCFAQHFASFFFFCVYPDYRLQFPLVGSFCGFAAHKKENGCETEQ